MARKLVDCPHCGGKRNCTRSGGRSCRDCLAAAGRSVHQWAVVRCSYCGGRGKVWQEEEAPEESPGEKPQADDAHGRNAGRE
jgi:DNA-directed RNA polymerase subunit RPC12/RpoP